MNHQPIIAIGSFWHCTKCSALEYEDSICQHCSKKMDKGKFITQDESEWIPEMVELDEEDTKELFKEVPKGPLNLRVEFLDSDGNVVFTRVAFQAKR